MQFEVFTLFPEVFAPYLDASILQRARQRGLVTVNLFNIRDYTTDRHHVCDDLPYGGGGGMVMKPEPIFTSVEAVLGGRDKELPEALAWEAARFGLAAATEDWTEGTRAFVEKRKPEFRGR